MDRVRRGSRASHPSPVYVVGPDSVRDTSCCTISRAGTRSQVTNHTLDNQPMGLIGQGQEDS